MPDAASTCPFEAFLTGVPQPAERAAITEPVSAFERGLTPIEEPVSDAIVLGLVPTALVETRIQLSQCLATVETGLVRTISNLALALALDAEVANPVLRKSLLVSKQDLITVSRVRSREHLAAVAERPGIRESITDEILARGSWPAPWLLVANRTACFSRQGLARLLALSWRDGHMPAGLSRRQDVLPAERTQLQSHLRDLALLRRSSA